jgi:hypothetical protein
MQKTLLLFLLFSAAFAGKGQNPDDSYLGAKNLAFRIGPFGFPEQMYLFTPHDSIPKWNNPVDQDSLLAENIHFHFTRQSDGKDIRLKDQGWKITKTTSEIVEWKGAGSSDELQMDLAGSLDTTGLIAYTVKATALTDLDLKDITMHIPFRKEMAGYMSGLGKKYGPRTDSMFLWKWKGADSGPEKVWIGTAKTGLQYTLGGGADWANEGKGGVGIGIKGKSMLANNYTGPRSLKKGEFLYFIFNLQIAGGQ